MNIYSDIGSLKGVGEKGKEALNKSGIYNVLDLLLYFPRDYENLMMNIDGEDISNDEKAALDCMYLGFVNTIRTRTGKNLSTLRFKYKNYDVLAKWFNQPYIKNSFKQNETYKLIGKYKKSGNLLEIINPVIGCNELKHTEISPKYHLTNLLTNKMITKLVNQILDNIKITENMPKAMLDKYNFVSLDNAIREIHFPKNIRDLEESKRRLKFQELFNYSIKVLMIKEHLKHSKSGIAFKMSDKLSDLKEKLPFSLTNAQSRVVREILLDQKRTIPMNRLVQGDVGSGKTIVAIIAMFNVIMNGYQCVLMAPTEILATQHYNEVCKVLRGFDIDIELLVGSTKSKEKERIKDEIRTGKPKILIGTHALIEDDVEFGNLGIIITDEQHRFGVGQRNKLINKNNAADVLVMTATPIPRTLALYLYSDLDISIIDELPPGRQKIDTLFFNDEMRSYGYNLALEQIKEGRQVYIVCPLIEENEDLKLKSVENLYNDLKEGVFKNIDIEILHGKMNPKEKDEKMDRFKKGETKVLISTTVIEVGVNVPNASVMIIENSERFGLSQLHQLRGRVGRGQFKSYCILIGKANNNITKKRMSIMTTSNDGFFIAEQDLKIRGTGDIFGLNQHGADGLILSDLSEDLELLKLANFEANEIIKRDDGQSKMFCREILKNVESSKKYICFN